jgi:hypothetical protein
MPEPFFTTPAARAIPYHRFDLTSQASIWPDDSHAGRRAVWAFTRPVKGAGCHFQALSSTAAMAAETASISAKPSTAES